MTNPLGSGVSRYINDRDRQFGAVVFQVRKPPLDSEWNLISLIDLEARAEEVRSRVASGWLMDEFNSSRSFHTDPTYSNLFFFGRNESGEVRNIEWANVNGWLIPVTGTRTGAPPLAPNDIDTWNKILLNPPSASTGGNIADFVFLEVWLATIDVDPASPGVAPGKPQRGFIYRFGNVESGYSFLADEIIDPDVNAPTTRRVQIQYRIRVVSGISIATYPDGFDQTTVFAQGLLSVPSVIPFVNMRQELGDPGLWRAGTGDPATFGTVDGYVYAIPICSPFRRNAAGFSDTGNLAGAFNRNSMAITRNDATIFINSVVLPGGGISNSDVFFTLSSITGTVFETMNSFGEAYFKIDDEIITIISVIPIGLNYQINIARGQLQTIVQAHNAGAALIPYTIRPDGLFADQVASTDILDLRHSIADKFDYENVLKTNLSALLKGKLRTAWKRYGSTNSSGPVVLYGDRITDASSSVGGLTKLDEPDGLRRIFSDSVTTQRFNVPVTVPSNAAALLSQLQTTVNPYDGIEVQWTATAPVHIPGNRIYTGSLQSWWNGDQISILRAPFVVGLPGSDADQVRFMLPTEDIDAVLVRFEGMTTDPNGGDPISVPPTVSSATNPNLLSPVPTGHRILKNGQGIIVTIDILGNLVITLNSGTTDTVFQEFLDALQSNTNSAYATRLKMHIEFTVVYGAGRGLSHKPDYIHSIQYNGSPANTSRTIRRDGLSSLTRMIPTYLGDSPYVQVGNNRALTKTSEVMIDPGSKTVLVAPYRNVQIPSLLARDGTTENWDPTGVFFQGCMPRFDVDQVNLIHNTVDPLNLFYYGMSSLYVEIPMEYLPKPGLHYTPIVPISNTIFSSGLNFLLMSKQGNSVTDSDHNPNLVSYPSGAGYYIITPRVIDTPFTTPGGSSIYGDKYINSKLVAANGGPFQGIQFPPFLAPARITGIYLRGGNGGTPADIQPVSTPFDTSRTFVGGPGTDINLMHDSFDGPTFLLDVDVNGDLSFILNADIIDFNKAPPGTTFTNSNFFVECTLFGFDRGFLQSNGRVLITRTSGGGSVPIPQDLFTNAKDDLVGLVTVAPLSAGAVNNEITIYYSRTPYQGDVFGTQNSYSDNPQYRGPLTVGEANGIFNNPLGDVSTLTLPNKIGFEVLAAISFTTSLGTGRFSGSVPTPLLTQVNAPDNPLDFAGTRVDLYRRFSANRVGFENWATPKFPINIPISRPALMTNALSEVFDNDVHPEFAGCTSNLPMGAYFRDKDFVGKTMYQMRSSSGVGSIPIGALAYVPFEASMAKSAEGASTWEGTEFICGNVSGTAGVGSEALIKVDGSSMPTSSVTVFKTNRGGAAWSATGPWPGGIISAKFLKARPNTEVGSIITGTAYLVRSAPESVGMTELHPGYELQMIVVTKAIPAYFRSTDLIHSADGTGEGYTAVDRFRIFGRPLEKKRGFVDASGASIPTGRPLFNNDIYDNPLLYGSADLPTFSQKDEILPILTNGQTIFTLSFRPVDPTAVTLYLNGNKLTNGVDFTISGPTDTVVTYIPSFTNPILTVADVLETWYMYF